jgi:hypothetical protein
MLSVRGGCCNVPCLLYINVEAAAAALKVRFAGIEMMHRSQHMQPHCHKSSLEPDNPVFEQLVA